MEPRTLVSLTEMGPTLNLGVNNADVDTLAAALLERMYYCKVGGKFVAPPAVDHYTFNNRLLDFKHRVAKIVGPAAPVSLDEVVEMYEGRKKAIYMAAKERLRMFGWKAKYARLKSFVKMEKVPPNKAPRCIQPRDPVYNLRVGAYIKPIEHRIYHAIDKIYGDGPTVIKGYNIERVARIMRGKWRSFKRPVAVGLDAMKFDMHVSDVALRWEHGVYNKIFRSTELMKLLDYQVNQQGGARCKNGHLTYKVVGRRASGDMNTALGNCLIMCALVHAYAKERGVDIKLMNNGDDCVVMMEDCHLQTFLHGLDAWFLEMGFRMTTEKPVYKLAEIEFCQMHPIESGYDDITMVRNIPTALRKDTLITVDVSTEKAMLAWCTAVGTGGLSLSGGIPVMQEFYRALIRIGKGVANNVMKELSRNSGMYMLGKDVQRVESEPTAEARLSVFVAWGITPDQQEALEEYYRNFEFTYSPAVGTDSLSNHNVLFHTLSR